MYVIKHVQARQAHAVPARVGRTFGPFPSELFEQSPVINPYNPKPEEWLICSLCGGRELADNVDLHECLEDEDG
jgi:hypothetical protein